MTRRVPSLPTTIRPCESMSAAWRLPVELLVGRAVDGPQERAVRAELREARQLVVEHVHVALGVGAQVEWQDELAVPSPEAAELADERPRRP